MPARARRPGHARLGGLHAARQAARRPAAARRHRRGVWSSGCSACCRSPGRSWRSAACRSSRRRAGWRWPALEPGAGPPERHAGRGVPEPGPGRRRRRRSALARRADRPEPALRRRARPRGRLVDDALTARRPARPSVRRPKIPLDRQSSASRRCAERRGLPPGVARSAGRVPGRRAAPLGRDLQRVPAAAVGWYNAGGLCVPIVVLRHEADQQRTSPAGPWWPCSALSAEPASRPAGLPLGRPLARAG